MPLRDERLDEVAAVCVPTSYRDEVLPPLRASCLPPDARRSRVVAHSPNL